MSELANGTALPVEGLVDTGGALALAQRRLQSLADGLPEGALSQEIGLAATLLAARLPSLPGYADLDAEHQAFYDIATGLRGAIALLAPAILAANDGLAKLKASDGTDDYEYTFTVPSLAERDRWAEEIAEAVGHLERMARPPSRRRRPFSMFGAAGVAQARDRAFGGSLFSPFLPEGWCLR